MLVDLRVYCDEPDLALALRGPSLLRGRSVTSIPKVCSSSTRERVLLHNPFLLSLRESMRSSRGGFVGAAYSAVDGVSAVTWHVCDVPRWAYSRVLLSFHGVKPCTATRAATCLVIGCGAIYWVISRSFSSVE